MSDYINQHSNKVNKLTVSDYISGLSNKDRALPSSTGDSCTKLDDNIKQMGIMVIL